MQIKDESKKLPFLIPQICTYPYFTALIAILSTEGKEQIWLYNNFILVWVMRNKYDIDYWIDFKFGNELIQEEFCPMIEKVIVKREDITRMYGDLRNAIKQMVNQDYYIMVSVDVFYVSRWWGNEKNRYHFRHQLCVHGYDYTRNVLFVSDFFEGKYSISEVDFDEFEKGYANYEQYTPFEDFGKDIWLLSYKKEGEEEINLRRIRDYIEDFLQSKDAHVINHIQLEKKESNYVFGLAIFDEIAEYLKMIKCKKEKSIDVRPFHLLIEMQKIMEWRFIYIINMYGISVDDLLEIIKKQCKDAEILKGLVIKYNIIGKVSIIDTIVKRVSSFAVGTKEMLEKCLVILDSVI